MNCLYLHIPFCRTKCPYCSFSSFTGCESLYDRYCAAICYELELHGPKHSTPLDTLFFGGGTPTALNGTQLGTILDTCKNMYGFAEGSEISIEANPGTVTLDDLLYLKEAGINRISFGVQSFVDQELRMLGRLHNSQEAEQTILEARQAGFNNLSFDLMYGLPGQTAKSWRYSLERAIGLKPDHLSAYQLSIDQGTGFAALDRQGKLDLPAEDIVLEMDAITSELCRDAGLDHYEISNFSRPGFFCRHNLNYWHNDEYLACGAGAVSYVDGVRKRRIADPKGYCLATEQGDNLIVERETLDTAASFRETVVMGLRLIDGVSEKRLQQRFDLSFDEVYGNTLEELINQGLVSDDGASILLTEKGRRLANQVMAELV